MKTLLLLLSLALPLPAATITTTFINSSECYLYATFIYNGGAHSGGYCVAPGVEVIVTYTYQGPGSYWWHAERSQDSLCTFRFTGFDSPIVGNSNSWVVGSCTNAYIPPDCECFAVIESVLPSPYVGQTNQSPHNFRTQATCTTNTLITHISAPGSANIVDDPNAGIMVQDGQIFGVTWPDCCTTGWGICATGRVWCLTNGIVSSSTPLTLSLPNWQGVTPCPQNGTPSDPSPFNNLIPPFSNAYLPNMGGEAVTAAFNGAIWEVHIACNGFGGCNFSFEERELFSCNRPVPVANYGNPIAFLIQQIGQASPPACTSFPAPHCISVPDQTLWYQWTQIGYYLRH